MNFDYVKSWRIKTWNDFRFLIKVHFMMFQRSDKFLNVRFYKAHLNVMCNKFLETRN